MLTRKGGGLCDWVRGAGLTFSHLSCIGSKSKMREAVSCCQVSAVFGLTNYGTGALWLPRFTAAESGFPPLLVPQVRGQSSVFRQRADCLCSWSLRLLPRVLEEEPSWHGPGQRLPVSRSLLPSALSGATRPSRSTCYLKCTVSILIIAPQSKPVRYYCCIIAHPQVFMISPFSEVQEARSSFAGWF